VQGGIPGSLVQKVQKRQEEIRSGVFRVNIDEAQPAGSVVLES
jgi:hypothetical protein